MSEYETVFRRKELQDMFVAGEVRPLDDLFLIEDAALTVQELMKELDFYKNLKKRKAEDISNQIKVVENKIDFFKDIILSTLKQHKEKSVKFPGSVDVSSRNQKAKWKIQDEEEFITVLQEAQKAGEEVDDVLEVVTQYNVRKREADKLMQAWEQSGKLEEFLKKARSKDIVYKEPPKTTVSFKFFEKEEEEDDVDVMDIPVPVKGGGTEDDYDTL